MSYFAFGAIAVEPYLTDEEMGELCFSLIEFGSSVGVFFIFGNNIKNTVVMEMLVANNILADKRIPFLMTRNPLADTSDSLISPHFFVDEAHNDLRYARLYNRFNAIQETVVRALRIKMIKRLDILLTEGYDERFEKIDIDSRSIARYLRERFCETWDIPSLWLVVRSEAGHTFNGIRAV